MPRVGGGDADLGETDLGQGGEGGVHGGDEVGDEIAIDGGHDLIADDEEERVWVDRKRRAREGS